MTHTTLHWSTSIVERWIHDRYANKFTNRASLLGCWHYISPHLTTRMPTLKALSVRLKLKASWEEEVATIHFSRSCNSKNVTFLFFAASALWSHIGRKVLASGSRGRRLSLSLVQSPAPVVPDMVTARFNLPAPSSSCDVIL